MCAAINPRRLARSVLPVYGKHGLIGTGTVIADGVALTALHVVAPESPEWLGFGHTPSGRGLPVYATATVPLDDYGTDRELAGRSWERARELTGEDDGTVDLVLLAVPGLRAPELPIRTGPPKRGERVLVPGYPGGQWSITRGPIVGLDESDFTVRLLLGPGASGAPVIDQDGRLLGVVTLDNESGTICVGPTLLAAFLQHVRASFGQTTPYR